MPLVEIENLSVSFPQHEGVVQAVRGVSLHLKAGKAWALWANPGLENL